MSEFIELHTINPQDSNVKPKRTKIRVDLISGLVEGEYAGEKFTLVNVSGQGMAVKEDYDTVDKLITKAWARLKGEDWKGDDND